MVGRICEKGPRSVDVTSIGFDHRTKYEKYKVPVMRYEL